MTGASFISHEGRRILEVDFSGGEPDELVEVMEEAEDLIEGETKNSVYTLTLTEDAHFNTTVVERLKEFTDHNKPWVERSAVVGISGLQKVVLQTVEKFSDREFEVFDEAEDALDWLVADD